MKNENCDKIAKSIEVNKRRLEAWCKVAWRLTEK